MTLDEFRATLASERPPDVSAALKALWYDAKGNWEKAHSIAQGIDEEAGAWIHAYLHRKEGDLGNAAYWYQRARKAVAAHSLDREWAEIVGALLS